MTDLHLKLKQLLGTIVSIERELSGSLYSLEKTKNRFLQVMNQIDSEILKSFLPTAARKSRFFFDNANPARIECAVVYEDNKIHANIFGFNKKGSIIPLHNHPNMKAVLKVIQGSVKIRSYTLLEPSSRHQQKIRTRYEGETILSSKDQIHCAFLDEIQGNIHEIEAAEDNSYFFDVFLPGYKDDCIYYYKEKERSNQAAGDEIELRLIKAKQPSGFIVFPLYFPTFKSQDLLEVS